MTIVFLGNAGFWHDLHGTDRSKAQVSWELNKKVTHTLLCLKSLRGVRVTKLHKSNLLFCLVSQSNLRWEERETLFLPIWENQDYTVFKVLISLAITPRLPPPKKSEITKIQVRRGHPPKKIYIMQSLFWNRAFEKLYLMQAKFKKYIVLNLRIWNSS